MHGIYNCNKAKQKQRLATNISTRIMNYRTAWLGTGYNPFGEGRPEDRQKVYRS